MWLSIRLAQLPLEALETSISEIPQAVIENNQIICTNEAANKRGIKLNQSISTAYALCDEIQLFERNLLQEKQHLTSLALLAYTYSQCVTIENSQLLLLEVGNSLKLYSTLENLLDLIKQDLNKEEVSYQLGVSNTPKSAELLSYLPFNKSSLYWQQKKQLLDMVIIQQQLSPFPISLLNLPNKTINQIQSVGIKNLGELKRLPYGAISKRFGQEVSKYLSMVDGDLADPKNYFVPEEIFSQKLEFVDVVHHRQGLLFPIKRLLKVLCRFLTVKQKISQSLHWELFDSEKNSIGFDVLLSDSLLNEKVYLELTQLNLERYNLHAPIEAISLTVDKLTPLATQTKTLFEESGGFKQNTDFINKIRAKLGNASCTFLRKKTEHLPELAEQQFTEIKVPSSRSEETMDSSKLCPDNKQIRPSWLLESPCPIHYNKNRLVWRGELKIISYQERITNYWWKKKVARDYFLAEHDNGIIYWVFFEKINKQWFIHGIYS